jgi:hypothetical protein
MGYPNEADTGDVENDIIRNARNQFVEFRNKIAGLHDDTRQKKCLISISPTNENDGTFPHFSYDAKGTQAVRLRSEDSYSVEVEAISMEKISMDLHGDALVGIGHALESYFGRVRDKGRNLHDCSIMLTVTY